MQIFHKFVSLNGMKSLFKDNQYAHVQMSTPELHIGPVRRKYESLLERIENLDSKSEAYSNLSEVNRQRMNQSRSQMQSDTKWLSENRQGPVITTQTHWNWHLHHTKFIQHWNETEVWRITQFINKRHTYSKSLKYSDRFYRNWATRYANDVDGTLRNLTPFTRK